MLTASEMAELDRRIAVMQAYRAGKKIQATNRGEAPHWWDAENIPIVWNWPSVDYRIAPEPRKPRECYVIFAQGSDLVRNIGSKYKLAAMADCRVESGDEVVHMREVLPD